MARDREAPIQAAIVQFIRTVAPQIRVYAIPNGGLRSKAEAAKLKWTGTLAGIPDLGLALPDGRHAWIEVKSPGEYLEPVQRDMRDALRALGHPYAVCRSIEDARDFLAALNIETRETA